MVLLRTGIKVSLEAIDQHLGILHGQGWVGRNLINQWVLLEHDGKPATVDGLRMTPKERSEQPTVPPALF